MPKVLCIIQARMGSTRLPGKVMKKLNDKPVLWHVHNRVKHSKKIDQIVIATTTLTADDLIVDFCKEYGIEYYRGDEQDVLSRYYETAKKYNGEIIVRITSDCPLIDPAIIDLMIDQYNMDWAYFSNCHPTRVVPIGLDVEITNFNFLSTAQNECIDKYQREHVFPFFYTQPDKFKLKNLEDQALNTKLRLTLDTAEDYELIKSIYNEFKEHKFYSIEQIQDILELKK